MCVASGGVGVCPGPGQNCQCQSGNCHETDAQVAADCAGACCTYVCTAGGDCCDNADCSAANYGYNPTSQCVSAQNAVAVQVCTAARLCGCPAPGPDTYVDGTIGSDTIGNGSAACPLRTITRALAIRGGTIINVRPGRYELGETFPLDLPANTTLQRDPTCAAGAAIIARTDSATTCPVQRGSGPAVSCAITVRQAGVQVHGLNIKNLHGRAIAFGSGANATSGVDSGVVGCESSVANACGRGGSEQRQDLEPIFVGGAASPVIGPAAGNALTLGGSLGSAIVIADSAQPSVRNIDGFTGYDDDVIRVVDAATPALTNLRINWPAGPITANTKRCVQVSGTGGATTLSSVWMAGCGTGGVIVTRAPNSAVPHTFTDVRVETSAGTPQGFGTDLNRREGFGLWLTATQGVSPVVVTGGRFANNRGHGVVVQDASLTMNGAVVEANGQQTASGTNCFGGNGLDLISAQAIAIVDASTFQGTRGRTSPPPAAPAACATGNGVHTQGGQLTLRGSRLTNNQFDGLLVDQGTQAAIVENNLFMSNTANGIETQIVNTQLGACTGATCVGGNNRFRECPTTPGGNNRANLCFVTTALVFVPPVLNAENNRWLNAPPDVSGDDNPPPPIPSAPRDVIIYNPFANGTLHCGGLGTHDVIIVSSPSSFFGLGPSVVNLNPTQTPLTCP
ncbi:MAG: DUF1565 domain-containing protein [Deltaproteobacteria bacterium]|nr:DUF1565 domain-containing protein [Deltaproteobacteria bacterium]